MSQFEFTIESGQDIEAIWGGTIETEEPISGDYDLQPRFSQNLKPLLVGAFCFLVFNPTQSLSKEFWGLADSDCSVNCCSELVKEYKETITELEDSILEVQSLTIANIDDYIDADDVHEEMNIIDAYMNNVRGFYKYRRHHLKL